MWCVVVRNVWNGKRCMDMMTSGERVDSVICGGEACGY